RTRGDYW
nr:immunoglobulin heavy chain junction region [Macaca mulatta]